MSAGWAMQTLISDCLLVIMGIPPLVVGMTRHSGPWWRTGVTLVALGGGGVAGLLIAVILWGVAPW